ncbi:MAG: ring-cleaving dioxygenase [Bacteroidetes bacterium QH_2_64_26]|nr:MAG: ring-cleaving dioxygenase [Bacteroidetes bacterium QH_2_64_26]
MSDAVSGIHHVTAYAYDPQENLDFYTGVLGLRLVKQTVLFNNPSEAFMGPTMYHFYYADETGTPGSVLTFKPHHSIQQGQVGRGQVTIPEDAVDYWVDRLGEASDATLYPVTERFGRTVIPFQDHDGQPLELITGASDIEPWADGPVPAEHALRGFHGVTIHPNNAQLTADVLELLGYEQIDRQPTPQDGDWTRFRVPDAEHGQFIDLYNEPNMHEGQWGYGTVHHVAFRASDDEHQMAIRERLRDAGHSPTTVKDRNYFHSIYFREPNGVNVEIATKDCQPGPSLRNARGSSTLDCHRGPSRGHFCLAPPGWKAQT